MTAASEAGAGASAGSSGLAGRLGWTAFNGITYTQSHAQGIGELVMNPTRTIEDYRAHATAGGVAGDLAEAGMMFVPGGAGKGAKELNGLGKGAQEAGAVEEASKAAAPMAGRSRSVKLDPAARRPTLREGTKKAIKDAAPKTKDADLIDPNTGQVIPKEGPYRYGHRPDHEWWRTQLRAREEGWTRRVVIEYENDPSHFRIEDPAANMSHKYERPR